MQQSRDLLLVFAKFPAPGEVKTRLAADIGSEAAAALYRSFIKHLMDKLVRSERSYDVTIAVAPASKVSAFRAEFPGADCYNAQVEGVDLGRKLSTAFEQSLEAGYKKVVIIGTDSPQLQQKSINQAFRFLETAEVVVGPADDGGYYLIGMREFHPELFEMIEWSSEKVWIQTRDRLRASRLRYRKLPVTYDVDDLPGLLRLVRELPTVLESTPHGIPLLPFTPTAATGEM